MKKLKKAFAGLLALAMMMSMMTMTAFAAEPDTILETTGSLKITKYETDGTTAIEGVEFSLYKLADISQTLTNGVVDTKVTPVSGTGLQAGDLEKIATGETTAAEWDELVKKVDFATLSVAYHMTTDVNGVVEFKDLPLAIYAVRETKAPSQVITKSANFIVSIPMTSANGDYWIYDVEAKPKNAVSRGGITLHKAGKTGNADTTENLIGVEFVLQHKKSDSEWEPVTVPGISDDKGICVTDATGSINVSSLNPGTYRFVEKSVGTANTGYIVDGKATYEFELKICDIEACSNKTHVYYDADNNGEKEMQGQHASDSEAGDFGYTIEVLNEKPTLEKTVKDGENYDNETDASIGDTVEWKVEASVPSKVNELNVFKLTDTMSAGLTWVSKDAADMVITTPTAALTENTDYTLTTPGDGTKGGTWTIEFTPAGKTKLADAKVTAVTVTFKTVLNEDAYIANTGSAGNLNEAALNYSNSILPGTDLYPDQPNTPGEDVIKDEATVYTFGIAVEKVDGQNNATKLPGVTFDLYKYNGTKTGNITETDLTGNDGEKIKVSGDNGTYKVDAAGTATLTTDTDGNITVNGLKKGTYYLVETKTNDGYNLLKEPVKVELSIEYTTKTETKTTTAANGTVTSTTVTTNTFTGGTSDNGIIKTTVENNKGFQLPTTGGMGTFFFSFIGIGMMIAAVILFFTSKKKVQA